MSSSPAQQERRSAQRFPFQIPVKLRLTAEGECQGVTQDVSARGALILTELKVTAGTMVEFVLVLPPEITLTESMGVRCRGKAVRVEGPGIGDKFGVAVAVEHHEFLPELSNQSWPVARATAMEVDSPDFGSARSLRPYSSRA